MLDCCLRALLFSLMKLIKLLDTSKYHSFKYFLQAILECTKELRIHLIYLIEIEHLVSFLMKVLTETYSFNNKEFDDNVLNFSLKVIVCEIFFTLKNEKEFFKSKNITENITQLIEFARRVMGMNIERKMKLVSNTLRLLSHMIASIHQESDAHEMIL